MGTLKLSEIFSNIRANTEEQFARLYSEPFLLRTRAVGELTSPLGYQTGFDLPSVKSLPQDDDTETSLKPLDLQALSSLHFPSLANESDIAEQFQLDSITKSQANTFPGITIGRALNNDIVVPINTVSKFHAWIVKESNKAKTWFSKEKQGGFLLHNANSRFGTFNNGVKVPEDAGSLLVPGDKIRLGDASLTFFDAPALYQWILAKLPYIKR